MGGEIFDVVDADDRVVGTAPRAEVHARGLRHRAVHVLVCDGAGRVFLQRRSLAKDCDPGLWDTSVSGHVDSGESYDACAAREIVEELGVAPLEPARALFRIDADAGTGHEFVMVYTARVAGPLAPDPLEVAGGGWLTPAQLDAWLREAPEVFSGTLRRLWERLGGIDPCAALPA